MVGNHAEAESAARADDFSDKSLTLASFLTDLFPSPDSATPTPLAPAAPAMRCTILPKSRRVTATNGKSQPPKAADAGWNKKGGA
jgi:hypothetical protein